MEAGLRKLFRRKKAKGSTEWKGTDGRDDPRSLSRPSFSTAGDERPSISIVRQSDRPTTADKLRSYDYFRSKPNNRIQPILVGISRPDTTAHRPGTAGSLYNAIQQAADGVHERTSQDLLRDQALTGKNRERSGSTRSVDIFAVAASLPNRASKFNEEVALRNLDTLRAAAINNATNNYVPSSRYQEEVADRNTELYSGRSSLDQSRPSIEYERTSSLTNHYARNVASPPPAGSYVHQPSNSYGAVDHRSLHQPLKFHSHHYVQRMQDNGITPSVSSHGRLDEDGPRRLDAIQENGIVKMTTPPSRNGVGSPESARESPVASRPDVQDAYGSAARLTGSNHFTSNPPVSSVDATAPPSSSPPPPTRHPARLVVPNFGPSQETHERQSSLDTSINSNSVFSARQERRRSSGRKVMDLTNEDAYSESSSMYGYSQYSPVLEHANAAAFHESRPVSAHGYTHVAPTPTLSISTGFAKSPALIQPSPRDFGDGQVASFSDGGPSPVAMSATPSSQIAFSPINTLASWSPRASAVYPYNLEESRPMSLVQRAAAAFEAREPSSALQTPANNLTELKREALPKPREVVHPERQESFHIKTTTPVQKAQTSKISLPQPVPEIKPTDQNHPTKPIPPLSGIRSAPHQSEEEKSSSEARSTSATAKSIQSSPKIYDSPGSLHSIDFKDPSNAFGVRTRDFAISPRKSTPSLKKPDSLNLARTATENASKVLNGGPKSEMKRAASGEGPRKKAPKPRAKSAANRVKTPVIDSEFDEEAFARKQAEAKAALLRLQASLKEDFMTMPLPAKKGKKAASATGKNGTTVASSSAATPTTQPVVSSESANSADATNIVNAINAVSTAPVRNESKGPPTSFRSPSMGGERTSSMSSTRSRSGGRTPRKGAPPALKNVEPGSNPINPTLLSPSLQLLMQTAAKPPRSPGEISLSSFPLPSSRPSSEHEPIASPSGASRPPHVRRASSKSQTSVASQFSIPVHMIPDRSSSVRDTLTEEDE